MTRLEERLQVHESFTLRPNVHRLLSTLSALNSIENYYYHIEFRICKLGNEPFRVIYEIYTIKPMQRT